MSKYVVIDIPVVCRNMSTESDGRRRKEERMEYVGIKICMILVSISCTGAGIGIILHAWWLRELVNKQTELTQQLKELKRQLL